MVIRSVSVAAATDDVSAAAHVPHPLSLLGCPSSYGFDVNGSARIESVPHVQSKAYTHGCKAHAYVSLWPYARAPYEVGIVSELAKPPLNETTREFGARIRARREELGLSQEAAALRCRIHWTQLGKVERGQRSLRLENIIKIAFGLNTTPGALLDGLPQPAGE
jgi:DNA-binding XRE family transcriptional regulator